MNIGEKNYFNMKREKHISIGSSLQEVLQLIYLIYKKDL